MPDIGEDEVGRLGEQLVKISKRWEDQVSSLRGYLRTMPSLPSRPGLRRLWKRARLARELHDAVSQRLFAISMTATAVGRTLDKDFDKAPPGGSDRGNVGCGPVRDEGASSSSTAGLSRRKGT